MDKEIKKGRTATGYLFALGATAIWSGNFIIARGLNESIPPVSLAFFRWLVAAIAILPFSLKALLAERKLIRKHLPYLAITALLGVTVFNTLVYLAGRTTTSINLSLISITFPVFVVIMSRVLYRDALTVKKLAGIGLVLAGVILLITRGSIARLFDITFAIGDLHMLAAALTFATYSILVKHRPPQLSLWAFQASTFLIGILFLSPAFVLERSLSSPLVFNPKVVLSILYIGLLASLTAFVFWNKAIEALGPTRAGMIYYTMPLFGGLWATLLLGESVTFMHLSSAALIVSGILISNNASRTRKP